MRLSIPPLVHACIAALASAAVLLTTPAVAEEPHFRRQAPPDGGERFIAARGGDAICFREQRVFKFSVAAAPIGDFQARAEFVIGVVK